MKTRRVDMSKGSNDSDLTIRNKEGIDVWSSCFAFHAVVIIRFLLCGLMKKVVFTYVTYNLRNYLSTTTIFLVDCTFWLSFNHK